MPTELQADILLDGLIFPESPRWRDGLLYFVDVYAGTINTVDLQGNRTWVADVPNRPSGLAFLPDGTLLTTSMIDQKLYSVGVGGEIAEYADLSKHSLFALCDMVTDSRGRAYVGSFGYDILSGADPAPGNVVLVDESRSVSVVAEDLGGPNGCVLTDDETTLFVAQTHSSCISAFDVNPGGTLHNRRDTDLTGLSPDGMCLDAEGALWVASIFSGEALRVTASGEITHRVAPPGEFVLATALAGDDRKTLVLCTAPPMTWPERGDTVGRLKTVRVDVPGAGRP